jgi:hypothetical protein
MNKRDLQNHVEGNLHKKETVCPHEKRLKRLGIWKETK